MSCPVPDLLLSQKAKSIGHLLHVHIIMSLEGYNSKRASFIAADTAALNGESAQRILQGSARGVAVWLDLDQARATYEADMYV